MKIYNPKHASRKQIQHRAHRFPLSLQRKVIHGCHFPNVVTDSAFNENELISLSTMGKQCSNLSNFFFQSKPSSWSQAKAILIAKLQFKRCTLSHTLPQGMHCIFRMDKIASLWGEKENIRFGIRTSEA